MYVNIHVCTVYINIYKPMHGISVAILAFHPSSGYPVSVITIENQHSLLETWKRKKIEEEKKNFCVGATNHAKRCSRQCWFTAADKWIRQRAGVVGRVTAGQTDQADQTDPVGAPEMKAAVSPQRCCRLQSSVAPHADHQPLASIHWDSLSLMTRQWGRQRPPSTLVCRHL